MNIQLANLNNQVSKMYRPLPIQNACYVSDLKLKMINENQKLVID